jgi:hypothetical protein
VTAQRPRGDAHATNSTVLSVASANARAGVRRAPDRAFCACGRIVEPVTGRDVQSDVGRIALSLFAASALFSCGGSSPPPEAAETLVSDPLATYATSPTQPSSTPPSSAVSTQPAMRTDAPAIVAAAAVARLTEKRFGGSAAFNRVNIVERYGAPSSDGMLDVGSDSPLIGAGVRTAVEHALAPLVVTWVDSINDVTGTGQDPVLRGGRGSSHTQSPDHRWQAGRHHHRNVVRWPLRCRRRADPRKGQLGPLAGHWHPRSTMGVLTECGVGLVCLLSQQNCRSALSRSLPDTELIAPDSAAGARESRYRRRRRRDDRPVRGWRSPHRITRPNCAPE